MATANLPPGTSGPTLRRPSQSRNPSSPASPAPAGALPGQDRVQPAPNPRPIWQLLAFGLIVFLGLLQLLPATHFRHPSDPQRTWVPFQPNTTNLGDLGTSSRGNSGLAGGENGDDGFLHVVSWLDCLDLQVLAVLMNSTLSSSRQEGIKETLRSAFHGHNAEQDFEDLIPFVVPGVLRSLGKFVYVSANVIVKGKVEELIGFNLKHYAVAAAEDCSQRLETQMNPDVLDAIQRSASKPWVSETTYAKSACMPDLNLLLIDARKFEVEFLDAVLWWSKALNLNNRNSPKNPAIALAIYNKFLELPSSWRVKESTSSGDKDAAILYDGPRTHCQSPNIGITLPASRGNIWTQYLPSMSDRILAN